MGEITSLAEALPVEIKRVERLREDYKALRGMPGVNVEPAVHFMTAAIDEGVAAGCSGDVVRMLRAFKSLKGFES